MARSGKKLKLKGKVVSSWGDVITLVLLICTDTDSDLCLGSIMLILMPKY